MRISRPGFDEVPDAAQDGRVGFVVWEPPFLDVGERPEFGHFGSEGGRVDVALRGGGLVLVFWILGGFLFFFSFLRCQGEKGIGKGLGRIDSGG